MFDTTLPQEEDIRPPCPATNDRADSVDLLLRETHHRMKNMLTLLGAWLRAGLLYHRRRWIYPRRSMGLSGVSSPSAGSTIFSQKVLTAATLLLVTIVGSLCVALTAAILEPKGIRCKAKIGDGFLFEALRALRPYHR